MREPGPDRVVDRDQRDRLAALGGRLVIVGGTAGPGVMHREFGAPTPLMPEVATIAEQGLKGFESYNWNGILAPAATPKTVIDRLNREIVKIVRSPRSPRGKVQTNFTMRCQK